MKKTLSILILCVSIFTLFSMTANAAEITYTPSDYYAVVSEINEKYDVRISIEQFADNVTKTPAELYAELEKLVLRSKANEAKKAAILAFDDDMALSTAKNLTRQTYHEELTKTSSVDSVFDITVMAEYYWNTTHSSYYFCGGSDVEVSTKTAFIGNFFFFEEDSGCKIWDGGRTLYAWATGDILYLSDGFGWYNYYDVMESVEFGYNQLSENN